MNKYQTGEEVLLGDAIQYSDMAGIVEFIVYAGTKAALDYHAPNGGIMLLLLSGGRVLVEEPSDEEDLLFVHRFSDTIVSQCAGSGLCSKLIYSDGIPIKSGDEVACLGAAQDSIRMRVVELIRPFSAAAWNELTPMGGFYCETEQGEHIFFGEAPACMRRREDCTSQR